jgi:hypothetical protein
MQREVTGEVKTRRNEEENDAETTTQFHEPLTSVLYIFLASVKHKTSL